jgi:DNA-directed RNA polymerase specialized sigma24 family protein
MLSKSGLQSKISRLNADMSSASLKPDREAAMLAVLRSDACYMVACAQALRFVSGSDDRAEAAHDLATRVLMPMFHNPGLFEGHSLFSTFLYAALRRANSKTLSQKIPDAIRKIHPLAPLVFELIVRDGWHDDEIRIHLGAFMPSGQAHELLRAVKEAVAKAPSWHRSRFGTRTFSELARCDDAGEPETPAEMRLADPAAENPLEILLDDEQRRIFQALLDRLEPMQRKLVEEYVLSRRVKTYKEAGRKLGIKDPAYELRKIGTTLRELNKDYE